MKNSLIAEKVAKLLLQIGAVTFRFNPPYTYTSGLKSPIYLDNRLVMSYPDVREKIIDYYIDTIKEKIGLRNVDWISATATAAIPHGAWVAGKLKLPMVFVRPTTKSYGKGGKVEGFLPKGAKVVIIEDHISTASSAVDNAQSIRELGGIVKYCVVTTTYETQASKKALVQARVTLLTLTTGKNIVDQAEKEKVITKKERISVDKWFTEPQNWAKTQRLG